MKLTTLLLTLSFMQIYAGGKAQIVTISGKDLSIRQIFKTIESQTGYVLFSNEAILSNSKLITIDKKNAPLKDVLDFILADQPLKYVIQGKTIILSRKENGHTNSMLADIEQLSPGITIGGVLREEDGSFLNAASVRVKGSNTGTMTNARGEFQLKNIMENAVIQISMIGYEAVEFTVARSGEKYQLTTPDKITFTTDNNSTPGFIFLIVNMEKSLSILDETQVIAYGRTSRRYSTGSIGTVKAEEIEKQPVMNVLQALEGRVAGLTISPMSGNSAAPVKVEIRGKNSLNPNALSEPLYVVDGMPLAALQVSMFYGQDLSSGSVQAGRTNTAGESPLLYLNPKDIESIDVLKDADATAIYGARGANGVILITTKRSRSGPTQFNMNIQRGSVTIPKKLDLLGTEEYLAVRREALRNDGITPTIYNAPDLMLWDQTKYTDWQDYFYKPGSQTSVDASVSGGLAQTNYRIAASYHSQTELNNNGGKNDRATASGSITHTSLNQKFQFDFLSQLGMTNVVAMPPSNFILTPPNAPDVYNELGEFNFEPYRGEWSSLFPFGNLKRKSESRTNTINTRLNLRYELIRGLNLSVAGSFSFAGNDNASYEPVAASDPAYFPSSMAYFGKSSSVNWVVDPQISYNTFIGKGNLSVQLGSSLQHVKNDGVTIMAANFPDDHLMRSPNNAAFAATLEGAGEYKFNAAFGIINYRWDNKYVVNLNGRRDGSSKFGPGKRFGNFGSIGLAWIASEEKWMKKAMPDWFSFLKFAGSYGSTGSDAVGDYEYLTRWGSAISLMGLDKLLDYNGTPSIHMLAHTNRDFRWESTNKLNTSVNIGLFEDKINIEGTYYRSRSGNQLTQIGTPVYTGFSSVRANWNAVVQNSGFEFSVVARFLNSKDWTLTGSFNIGVNKNKLIEFPGLENSPYASKYEVGKSMRLMYLFKYIGINPTTGDYTFEDHNKDGVISFPTGDLKNSPEDDRYIVYDLNDKFNGGMTFNISYKSFALYTGFAFRKRLARDPFINVQAGTQSNLYLPQEVKDNHWKQPGDIAKYPKYTTLNLDPRLLYSDAGYQDASFLQMNNLAFSYDLPAKIINKIKMKGCRLAINTQNIFTITSFKGIDPRISSMVNGVPTPRTISSSLTFNF